MAGICHALSVVASHNTRLSKHDEPGNNPLTVQMEKYQTQNSNSEGSDKMADENCSWYVWCSPVGIGILLAGIGILLFGLGVFLDLFIGHGAGVTTSVTLP